LPPNDPRFLDTSIQEIELDYHTHKAAENPNAIEDETDDDVFAEELSRMDADDWEPV
jgi:hypothetical protein